MKDLTSSWFFRIVLVSFMTSRVGMLQRLKINIVEKENELA